MSDITDSERRLVAALDRIDRSIEKMRVERSEAAASGSAAARVETALAEAEAENARLGDEIAALRSRLTEAGHETVRLAAANDALTEANQKLLAGKGGAVEATAALRAELEALRATRAAEIAQMDDILGSLERMLSGGARVAMGGPVMATADLAEGE